MHGLLCVSVNKVKVGGTVETLKLELKLNGETITTNSLVAKVLVYGTRDNGSNPSW